MMQTKRRTRLAALLIAVLLAVTCFPLHAFAAPTFASADAACYNAMKNRVTEVDVSGMGLTEDNFSVFQDEFRENHPDIFYGSPMFYTTMGGKVVSITLFFDTNISVANIAAYEAAVQKILDGVQPGWTDVQKVLYFHDYLATHCEYDMRLLSGSMPNESYNVYGAIVNRQAVCNGYALALCDLCNRVSIPCHFVESPVMNHAWNVVQVGGSWYHVDVTWDDPINDIPGNVRHSFFLLSDSAIKAKAATDGTYHTGWKSPVSCTNTKYDKGAYWSDAVSAVLTGDDGNAYYVTSVTASLTRNGVTYPKAQTMSLVRRDASTGKVTTLYTVSDIWPAWTGGNYYTTPYMKLARVGDCYYFNDASHIYCYRPGGKEVTSYSVDTSTGYLYGLAERDGKLYATLSTVPDEKGKTYTVPVGDFMPELGTVTPEPTPTPTPAPTPTPTPTPKPAVTELDPVYAEPQENYIANKRDAIRVRVVNYADVTFNGRKIDSNYASYPLILYQDMTYIPMTYYDSRFLGLTTAYTDPATGLFIDKASQLGPYCQTLRKAKNADYYNTALLAGGPITVNGKKIDNASEPFPLLVFRGVTYFPVTWRFMMTEFGFAYYNWSPEGGLVINAN